MEVLEEEVEVKVKRLYVVEVVEKERSPEALGALEEEGQGQCAWG